MPRTNFKQRRWTANEIAILKAGLEERLPMKSIARKLGRSPQSAAQKKSTLGVSVPYIKYTARHSFYVTPEMDAAIHRKAHATGLTHSAIIRNAVEQYTKDTTE